MVANGYQDKIASRDHKQDAETQSGATLEETPKRADPDAAVQVGPAKRRLESPGRGVGPVLLLDG